MINGEKRSAVGGSLYGLRRSVIRALDSQGVALAVYGPGWDDPPRLRFRRGMRQIGKSVLARVSPQVSEALGELDLRPRHWLGTVEDKRRAFRRAPTSIVIENSADYVSEKLIDAVTAGVVPLYVGPPLSVFGLPSDIAIECLPNPSAVIKSLAQLTPSRSSEITQAGDEWLRSEASRSHEITQVLRGLGRTIGLSLNST